MKPNTERNHLPIWAAMCWLPLSLGCFGGLENQPFEDGQTSVAGSVSGTVDPANGWASIVGRPDLRARLDAAGRFELTNVPSGQVEVAVSAGPARASRMIVHAYADRPVQLQVDPGPAMAIMGAMHWASGHPDATSVVDVDGLPVHAPVDTTGQYTIAGLPPGCHMLIASQQGLPTQTTKVCGHAGNTVPAMMVFSNVAAASLGDCVPCADHALCASGACGTVHGESVCLRTCDAAHACGAGLSCEAGTAPDTNHYCVPDHSTCAAQRDAHAGQACEAALDCGLAGIDDGACSAGHCALPASP